MTPKLISLIALSIMSMGCAILNVFHKDEKKRELAGIGSQIYTAAFLVVMAMN